MLTFDIHNYQEDLSSTLSEWGTLSDKTATAQHSLSNELNQAFAEFVGSVKAATAHFHRELEGSLSPDVGTYWGIVDRESLLLGPKRNRILQAIRVANYRYLARIFQKETRQLISRYGHKPNE